MSDGSEAYLTTRVVLQANKPHKTCFLSDEVRPPLVLSKLLLFKVNFLRNVNIISILINSAYLEEIPNLKKKIPCLECLHTWLSCLIIANSVA